MLTSSEQLNTSKISALNAVKSSQWKQAQAFIMRILQSDNQDAEVWYWLGLCQVNKNNHLEAAKSFKRSVSLDSKYLPAQDALGGTLLHMGKVDAAIASFKNAIKINSNFSQGYAHLGNAFRIKGEIINAEISLKKALELKGNDLVSLLNLGLVYQEQNKLQNAEQAFRKAITLNQGFPNAHVGLGNIYHSLGKLELAVTHYEKAAALLPKSPEPLVSLGLVLEKLHRLEDAKKTAQTVLNINNMDVGANLLYARLAKRNGLYEMAERRLKKILTDDLAPPMFSEIATELGHTLDKQGRYDEAFEIFSQANKVLLNGLESTGAELEAYFQHIQSCRDCFTENFIEGWNAVYDDGIPDPIFLVGFPRSGTTLIEQILESHDHLLGSREEPFLQNIILQFEKILGRSFVYPNNLSELTHDEVLKLRKYYWDNANNLFGNKLIGKRLVDKLPLNIVELGLVKRLFPNAKIIVCLRDPRDSCLSCFMQSFALNQAMAQFLDLASTTRLYSEVMKLLFHYKTTLSLNMMDYQYEELVEDFPGTTKKILHFIGENWSEQMNNYSETARKRYANTPSYQAVTLPIYKVGMGRWKNYTKHLEPFQESLAPFVIKFGYLSK